jgi:CHAT domain-containing protein
MERGEAVEYCTRQLERLKANGAPKKVLLNARFILEWAQDTDAEQPFAHPYFWGATAIVGSGWHLPASAMVGPPEITIENTIKLTQAEALAGQFKPRDALALAQEVAARADGVFRARAYAVMAWALLQSAHLSTIQRVRRKAARLLKHAERIALTEEERTLRDRVRRLQAQMEADHVADQDG